MIEHIPPEVVEAFEYVGGKGVDLISDVAAWSGDVALEEIVVEGVKRSYRVVRQARQTEALMPALYQAGSLTALLERMEEDEDIADLVHHVLDSAARSALRSKRIAMGLVVKARLAGDDATVDEAPLMLRVLDALDRPDVATLTELGSIQPNLFARAIEPKYVDLMERESQQLLSRISAVVDKAHPLVRSTLIANGLVVETIFVSGPAITGVSPFGARFLAYLEDARTFDPLSQ